ncbi:MAG: LEA type 2 family protein [Chitinophagales bacterium]
MKKRLIGIGIAFAALLVVMLLNKKEVTVVKQNNFALKPIGSSGVELSSTLSLNNPNLLSSTIQTIHEKYSINGYTLGALDIELSQGISGRKTTDFPVAVRFSRADLLNAMNGDSLTTQAPLHITGEIIYKNFTGGGTIKIDLNDSIKLQF